MRRKHEMISGRPISCWDDGDGDICDRYTVVFLDTRDERGNVQYLGMSAHPSECTARCRSTWSPTAVAVAHS